MTYGATKDVLAGRTAICGSCKHEALSENASLVDFRGEGSYWATETCGFENRCGYHEKVHQEINPSTGRAGVTEHEFAPRGPAEKDSFYCGCRGWD